VLINNAAFHGGAPDDHRVGTLDAETFQTYMSVNVFGPLAVSEAFLESVQMSDQKKIVTLSSGIASLANPPPVDGFHFHAISKTAVNRAMRGLQVQLRGTGVIVALISPGGVDTDGFAAAVQAYQGGRGSG
jgi:NAD(P)-dependent dehydrogenase (short-subunit alcohol dehydrogenase family)